ncbi:dihydrofolate reductase [Salmonella enterica subsp. enterica serovar Bovismorbificans]|nr:dihydrofolate reductase [Salmonella enterica subsp. enterica serovar Bovismorbificans]EIM4514498.1 dihydrofolate reductase [Salmonella enterica subsp. enterica serovar Bovismorbificans]
MTVTVSLIAAAGLNNEIGKDNKLPWHIPDDLKNFKALTSGKVIVMGRKTWESLGYKPLPNRHHVILTRKHGGVPDIDGVLNLKGDMGSVIEFLKKEVVEKDYPKEIFIIGGAEIYRQALPYADKIYLSRVEAKVDGADAFFPEIDRDVFKLVYNLTHCSKPESGIPRWHYQIWKRDGN